jgi:hypothetical protein
MPLHCPRTSAAGPLAAGAAERPRDSGFAEGTHVPAAHAPSASSTTRSEACLIAISPEPTIGARRTIVIGISRSSPRLFEDQALPSAFETCKLDRRANRLGSGMTAQQTIDDSRIEDIARAQGVDDPRGRVRR